ncbi:TobH protein [Mycobacterium paraense]|uniref:TobH protein n=1 Tax=Mycobacterium paraense TaxID=767916 RepID=A0A1X2A3X5_9MYCO|nr:TobH protein [Mycobacterium paraense]MCV7444547.1 TobH protein [Mycobacterium paraense]ORW33683.1 TobH protein [Mycobacterium paraense]ORW38030.1 TobH protein [Mycobacterium paraense]ORW41911.1 TobH protein [Mycobacterium paraense]ORW44761.1 TobH protein [Mycobacterium paraense]
MNATAAIDLEDADGLLAADTEGLLRAASSAGAQVRAIAAATDEGALDSLRTDDRARSVIWVAGRGTAGTAGAILAATLGGVASQPIVVTGEAPPWVGPLDVLVVAGDDPGDPALVTAAATAVRRGARVVVAAPYEGPLRDSTAGRAAVLEPRVWVPDELGLCRYLAAGLAVLGTVDPRPGGQDLGVLADELDAEALRNSAGRELFTNPAKTIAARIAGRRVALAGDCAATLALARHGSSVLLRLAHEVVAAAGLADAVLALRAAPGASGGSVDDLFHDEEIDGPRPERLRVLALTLSAEQTVVAARTAGFDDVYLLAAEDVPDGPGGSAGSTVAPALGGAISAEQQLAVLAVRLEMAAVYMRLVRG